MHRTFATSTTRKCTYLDGTWDFVADPDDAGIEEGWYHTFPQSSAAICVPGVWNTRRSCLNYEGAGWFRTRLSLSPCSLAAIHFASVTHQANVWLDGEPLGEHYGGFLPFSSLLARPEPGEHELVVRVDNTHDMTTTIPSAHLDWFRYGGIPRPVWVEELQGPGYVVSLRLVPVAKDGKATLRVRTELVNLSSRTLDDTWTLHIEEDAVLSGKVRLAPGDSQVLLFAHEVRDVRLWSPGDPQLYRVRLAFAGDDLIDRTGFRELKVAGREVLLNGEPVQILGVNRHEDHPEWGFALPQRLMLRDLDLANDLGANAIRGAHYPNDQRMLDLCDERGILFMEEIPLWGFSREQMARDVIGDRASAMLWAMIDRDVNHPCIWAWSVLSECATHTPEGRMMVERLVETAREADPTRPVTFSSGSNLEDICFDLVDIVCVNAGHGSDRPALALPELLDRIRAKIGDRPLIVSEFGAGATPGRATLEGDAPWSEEHQRRVLTGCIAHLLSRDHLLGFYIWQLFDTRSDAASAGQCPRGYDKHGLLDEYRRPKLAYHAVRDLLAQANSARSRPPALPATG